MKLKFVLVFMLFAINLNAQVFNKTILDTIAFYAKKTNSSDISIMSNGKTILNDIYEKDFEPTNIMSATKSIASLAVGILLKEERLKSIDTPLYQIFTDNTDWQTGMKKQITVRHILNHTSGLEVVPTSKIYESGDCVLFALNSEVKIRPGTKWEYNNNAINLVSGIVQKLTNKSMHSYLQEKLFTPLGIINVYWTTDTYMKALFKASDEKKELGKEEALALMKQGNNLAMDGLCINSSDLVKIGKLLFDNGNTGKLQIIDKSWIKASTDYKQNLKPSYGFSWWLIPDPKNSYITIEDRNIEKVAQINKNDTLLTILKSCKNKKYLDVDAIYDDLDKLVVKYNYPIDNFYTIPLSILTTEHINGIIGYYAAGTNGNRLYILPDKKIVAARTISQTRHQPTMHDGFHDNFPQIEKLLLQLN